MKCLLLMTGVILCSACSSGIENEQTQDKQLPIIGTWKLISGVTVEGKDTTFSDYTENQETIKIINETHFSFLRHDLTKGQDSSTLLFVAGGGKYELNENKYTEHLSYCNYRSWEGHTFEFELILTGDTLIQTGIEKIEKLNVDRIITETYIKGDL